jgi:hypothetical protein
MDMDKEREQDTQSIQGAIGGSKGRNRVRSQVLGIQE